VRHPPHSESKERRNGKRKKKAPEPGRTLGALILKVIISLANVSLTSILVLVSFLDTDG
jgi:hypothetical protein